MLGRIIITFFKLIFRFVRFIFTGIYKIFKKSYTYLVKSKNRVFKTLGKYQEFVQGSYSSITEYIISILKGTSSYLKSLRNNPGAWFDKRVKYVTEETGEKTARNILTAGVAAGIGAFGAVISTTIESLLIAVTKVLDIAVTFAFEPLNRIGVEAFGGGTPSQQLAGTMMFIIPLTISAFIFPPMAIFVLIFGIFFIQGLYRYTFR